VSMADARTHYRENAVRGASRVGLVVLLYEQMISDLRGAVEALEKNQIQLRTQRINHAIVVIGHLQGTLNLHEGGEVAQNLNSFYAALRRNLVQAQARASREILDRQIDKLLELRDAWIEVERHEAKITTAGKNQAAPWPGLVETRPGTWKG